MAALQTMLTIDVNLAWERAIKSAQTPFNPLGTDILAISVLLLALCGLIGIPSGFLRWKPVKDPNVWVGGTFIFVPIISFLEEGLFRAALLPHPATDGGRPRNAAAFALDALLPLLLFTFPWHLATPRARARAAFWDWRFLALATLLGAACSAAHYASRGSLYAAVLVHWLPVVLWLFCCGGWQAVHAKRLAK